MTHDDGSPPPETIDGHTMDELADYLRAGRSPYDASIESSAACRLALANMTRLSQLTTEGLVRDAADHPERDEVWIAGLLDTIRAEIVSGRDIPVSHPDPVLHLTQTEAAVRGVIRRAGDRIDGVVMERCILHGRVDVPGEIVSVEIVCAVEFGRIIADVLEQVRLRVREVLSEQTELVIGRIDVTVDDVYTRGERNS